MGMAIIRLLGNMIQVLLIILQVQVLMHVHQQMLLTEWWAKNTPFLEVSPQGSMPFKITYKAIALNDCDDDNFYINPSTVWFFDKDEDGYYISKKIVRM
ncbi:MAG: hypothetical protein U5N10_05270 [Gemmobacter sp.]|nr:hypothetical protein [Gemmobacter sp.]